MQAIEKLKQTQNLQKQAMKELEDSLEPIKSAEKPRIKFKRPGQETFKISME